MTEAVRARKIAEILARVERIRVLLPASAEAFVADRTASEALILNLLLALQACADLALHTVAERGLGVPASARAAYTALADAGILDAALAKRLAGAVGLRNRIAHEYGALDLHRVYAAARDDVPDLEAFAAAIVRAFWVG